MRCPGYDHDTSPRTTSNAKTSQKKSFVSIQPRKPGEDAAAPFSVSPNIPIEELTSCHFVANFILVPQLQGMRGFFQFVAPLLSIKHDFPHFRYAFEACSVASLNNRLGRKNDMEATALGSYTRALTATRKALRDPKMIKHDATLAAVLLLGLYETITANFLGTMAWGSHIDGAVQLLKSRNGEQVRSKEGLDLFIAARTQMVSQLYFLGKKKMNFCLLCQPRYGRIQRGKGEEAEHGPDSLALDFVLGDYIQTAITLTRSSFHSRSFIPLAPAKLPTQPWSSRSQIK